LTFKLLLPTYRARERYIRAAFARLAPQGVERMLHVGSGEGEVDHWLSAVARHVDSIDINHGDVAVAHASGRDLSNVRYSVQDGERMAFAGGAFDMAVCLEVIEHAAHPLALLEDIGRVLRPGGHLILTCPHARYPFTYDPLNRALAPLGKRLPIGAYGYGHHWLATEEEVTRWARQADFEVESFTPLSHHLVGMVECYAPGVAQRLLKRNSANTGETDEVSLREAVAAARSRRPFESAEPPGVQLTDLLIALDGKLGRVTGRSIGLAWTLRRR